MAALISGSDKISVGICCSGLASVRDELAVLRPTKRLRGLDAVEEDEAFATSAGISGICEKEETDGEGKRDRERSQQLAEEGKRISRSNLV